MAKRSPYGAKFEVLHGKDGAQCQIYLDKYTGVFTADIEGGEVQDTNLKNLRTNARKAMAQASKLDWRPVILLGGVRGKEPNWSEDRFDSSHNAEFRLAFERVFMVQTDKAILWRSYRGTKPDDPMGDTARAWYNPTVDRIIPYTEKRWQALLTLVTQIEKLQEKFNEFLRSDEAEKALEEAKVPLLISGEEEAADAETT